MVEALALRSRLVNGLMKQAHVGLHEGNEQLVQHSLNRINALLLYRVVHVYVENGQFVANVSGDVKQPPRIGPNWTRACSLPLGLMHVLSRITEYYMDGRIRVIMDRERKAPYWVIEHATHEGVVSKP